jgi:D-3-phosphoglycerate dehydrogenase
VGFGRIGRMVAQLVRGFGARLVAADPMVTSADAATAGVELVSLDGLLEVADLISLHAPGDGVLVDEALLRRIRSEAVLVNTARAALVDEAAVAAALRSGQLGSYAADVVGDEGATGAAALDSPLLAADLADRTVLTPHIAAQTVEAVDLMGRGAVDAVLAVLQGDNPPNLVAAVPGARSEAVR